MIRVGTSGYSYAEWRGSFYPADLPARGMLAAYAARLSTVEINATFYRLPPTATLVAWAATTPAEFVFALKAPQRITHQRRLIDVDEPVRRFCDVVSVLGPKRGPLLFQLPPSLQKETGRLADLLAPVPPGWRIALEFRHTSWFAADVYDLLRARDAALCIADTEAGTTPPVTTASWGYLRLRDNDYTDEDLDGWVAAIAHAGWQDAYVYFKHDEGGRAPVLAARLSSRTVRSAP